MIALKVIEVPLEEPLDCSMPEEDKASRELLALCESFAEDYGIEVECRVLRARAISSAVAHEAREADAGLILIGAVPRPWDAAGRAHVFSETVENVIRRSHCRVIVTSFPAGTASVDAVRHATTPAGGPGAARSRSCPPRPAPRSYAKSPRLESSVGGTFGAAKSAARGVAERLTAVR